MKKVLSSLLVIIALGVTSVSSMAGTVFEVGFGQVDVDTANQASAKAKGMAIKAGWLNASGLGFELSHATYEDTENRTSVTYLDGALSSNTKYAFKATTLDLVKEFSLSPSLSLVTKLGISKVTAGRDYRENYKTPAGANTLVTHNSYNDYANEAAHAYVGLAYNLGYSSVTLGADLYKNGDIKSLAPSIGIRVRI
jgi:hypothetical protein